MDGLPVSCFDESEKGSDGEGSEFSDMGCSEPPAEPETPVKKRRISVAECFELSVTRRTETSSSSLSREVEMERRFSMSDLFTTGEDVQGAPEKVSRSRPVAAVFPVEEVATWHPNRLWSIIWQQVVEAGTPVRRVRLRTKGVDWRGLLERLKHEPELDLSNEGNALCRVLAYDCFTKAFARYSGCSWRIAKATSARAAWKKASKSDKMKWYVLKEALGVTAFAQMAGRDQESASGSAATAEEKAAAEDSKESKVRVHENCVGIMVTYNTCIGLKDPDIMMLVQEDLPLDEFIAKLAKQEIHNTMFKRFWCFLQELGQKLKFQTVGASLELSEHSEDKGRVHLHGYLGTSIKGGPASMCGVVQANVDETDLIFSGIRPFVRSTRPRRKHPKTIFDAVVNGLYYVVAKKMSSILREATFWPIQEVGTNRQAGSM